jgi:hypothetical protein
MVFCYVKTIESVNASVHGQETVAKRAQITYRNGINQTALSILSIWPEKEVDEYPVTVVYLMSGVWSKPNSHKLQSFDKILTNQP